MPFRMDDFFIKQFEEHDWEDYRAIRLEAIHAHPEYFCPSRDENKFLEGEWKERISNQNGAIFGLYCGKAIVGLTGIIREGNNPQADKAQMVMSYIKKDYRRRGLSELFYKARIDWAKCQDNLRTIIIEHRDDNVPSQKAHQKFNSEFVESRSQTWPDGSTGSCLVYKMDV